MLEFNKSDTPVAFQSDKTNYMHLDDHQNKEYAESKELNCLLFFHFVFTICDVIGCIFNLN